MHANEQAKLDIAALFLWLQIVHDVDQQKAPVRFAITNAGLVGADGPVCSGPFDITFMSCLPNMIVMAPSDEFELARMVVTAAQIDDRPVCFRYPSGSVVPLNNSMDCTVPIEVLHFCKVRAPGRPQK